MTEKGYFTGYFTIEAALLLPMTLLFIVMMIFLGFYSYDRCILEQSAWQAAVRGSSNQFQSNEEAYQATCYAAESLIKEKLFAVKDITYGVTVTALHVEVSYECSIQMPCLTWLGEYVEDTDFTIHVKKTMYRSRQTAIVRARKQLQE